MAEERYQYQPLERGHIRLLERRGYANSGQPHVDITHVQLDQAPDFAALSYCWGDQSNPKPIFVDEQSCLVTRNLYQALVDLRFHDVPRYIWIDAVCIDQSNVEERNHQVQVMKHIYALAAVTFSYLGPDSGSTEKAYRVLELHETWQRMRDVGYRRREYALGINRLQLRSTLYVPTISDQAALADLPPYDARAIVSLLQHSYWTRTWIFPEFLISKNITLFAGSNACDWRALAASLSMLKVRGHAGELCKEREARHLNADRPGCTLLDLLRKFGQGHCKDIRDKVFAMLSLHTCRPGGTELKADYNKSTVEVLLATLLHIQDHNTSASPVARDSLALCSWLRKILREPAIERHACRLAGECSNTGAGQDGTSRHDLSRVPPILFSDIRILYRLGSRLVRSNEHVPKSIVYNDPWSWRRTCERCKRLNHVRPGGDLPCSICGGRLILICPWTPVDRIPSSVGLQMPSVSAPGLGWLSGAPRIAWKCPVTVNIRTRCETCDLARPGDFVCETINPLAGIPSLALLIRFTGPHSPGQVIAAFTLGPEITEQLQRVVPVGAGSQQMDPTISLPYPVDHDPPQWVPQSPPPERLRLRFHPSLMLELCTRLETRTWDQEQEFLSLGKYGDLPQRLVTAIS